MQAINISEQSANTGVFSFSSDSGAEKRDMMALKNILMMFATIIFVLQFESALSQVLYFTKCKGGTPDKVHQVHLRMQLYRT